MTNNFLASSHSCGRSRWLSIAVSFVALTAMVNVQAQVPAATSVVAAAPSTEALEKLVDRIALYPDDLVAIILPAATNPLQLVQADRYLEKRKSDAKLPVDENWDDAVKSLLNYPEVVKTMSDDLDWTSALGEAVVADQGAVLEAIQSFRRKTQAAGNLKSDAKQVVVVEKEIITIVPADPQVIYVPQYNPSTVVVYGGYSSWGYYPSPYPVYYYPYPPGAAFATGLIWGAAISSAWHGGHYSPHYGGSGSININRNTNINTGNINTGNVNRSGGAGRTPAGGSSQWKSNKQPGQVSGSAGQSSSARAGYASSGGSRSGASARASTQPSGGSGSGASARASTQPSGGSANRANSDAFSGYGSGRQAQSDSSRGASSRSSMQGSSARSSSSTRRQPSGGGSRGGGGGRRR